MDAAQTAARKPDLSDPTVNGAPSSSATMPDSPIVFFSIYEPEDYDLYRGRLLDGRVRLDAHSDELIGPRPDWAESPTRSNSTHLPTSKRPIR